MKSFGKRILLFVFDAITLYLSFYVSFVVLDMFNVTVTDTVTPIAYIPVAIKIGVYFIFFMYSMNRHRSYLLDFGGVVVANAAAVFALNYLYEVSILGNWIYFAVVFAFDLIICLMLRYIFRTSKDEFDYDEYDDDDDSETDDIPDDEEQEEEEMSKKPMQGNDDLFQQSIFDTAYIQEQAPITRPIQQTERDLELERRQDELERLQREKDRKIDRLIEELDAKQEQIHMLEHKIEMQSAMAYDDYSNTETYINDNKKEILDKILEDVKDMYTNLNSRSRIVEDREYSLLLKMVELEEKQRALEEIQSITRYSSASKKRRSSSYRPSRQVFSDVYNLPKDNPNLSKNIVRTIDSLHATKQAPTITLAQAPIDPNQTYAQKPKRKEPVYNAPEEQVPVKKVPNPTKRREKPQQPNVPIELKQEVKAAQVPELTPLTENDEKPRRLILKRRAPFHPQDPEPIKSDDMQPPPQGVEPVMQAEITPDLTNVEDADISLQNNVIETKEAIHEGSADDHAQTEGSEQIVQTSKPKVILEESPPQSETLAESLPEIEMPRHVIEESTPDPIEDEVMQEPDQKPSQRTVSEQQPLQIDEEEQRQPVSERVKESVVTESLIDPFVQAVPIPPEAPMTKSADDAIAYDVDDVYDSDDFVAPIADKPERKVDKAESEEEKNQPKIDLVKTDVAKPETEQPDSPPVSDAHAYQSIYEKAQSYTKRDRNDPNKKIDTVAQNAKASIRDIPKPLNEERKPLQSQIRTPKPGVSQTNVREVSVTDKAQEIMQQAIEQQKEVAKMKEQLALRKSAKSQQQPHERFDPPIQKRTEDGLNRKSDTASHDELKFVPKKITTSLHSSQQTKKPEAIVSSTQKPQVVPKPVKPIEPETVAPKVNDKRPERNESESAKFRPNIRETQREPLKNVPQANRPRPQTPPVIQPKTVSPNVAPKTQQRPIPSQPTERPQQAAKAARPPQQAVKPAPKPVPKPTQAAKPQVKKKQPTSNPIDFSRVKTRDPEIEVDTGELADLSSLIDLL